MAEVDAPCWDDSEECGKIIDFLDYKCSYLSTMIFWEVLANSNTPNDFKRKSLEWIEDVEYEIAEVRRLAELIPD